MDKETRDLLVSCYALLLVIRASTDVSNKRVDELTEQIRIKIGFPEYDIELINK